MDSQRTVHEENLVDPTPNEDTLPGNSNTILSTTEAVDDFPLLSEWNFDTIATKTDVLCVDGMMLIEDLSRTRDNPEVLSDKKSDMENLLS